MLVPPSHLKSLRPRTELLQVANKQAMALEGMVQETAAVRPGHLTDQSAGSHSSKPRRGSNTKLPSAGTTSKLRLALWAMPVPLPMASERSAPWRILSPRTSQASKTSAHSTSTTKLNCARITSRRVSASLKRTVALRTAQSNCAL